MLPAPPTAWSSGPIFEKNHRVHHRHQKAKNRLFRLFIESIRNALCRFYSNKFCQFCLLWKFVQKGGKKYEQHAVNQLEMSSSIAATRIPMSNTVEQRIRLYNPATRNKSIWKRSAFPRVSFSIWTFQRFDISGENISKNSNCKTQRWERATKKESDKWHEAEIQEHQSLLEPIDIGGVIRLLVSWWFCRPFDSNRPNSSQQCT